MLGYTVCLIVVGLSAASFLPDVDFITSFCNLEQVVNCTKDLDVLGKQIAPFYKYDELDLLCSKWLQAEPCLVEVAVACELEKQNGTEEWKTKERIIARKRAEQAASEWIMGYEYLCFEGRESYAVVQDCMSKNHSLARTTEQCYKTYDNQTWWLDTDEPINTHKFCKAAREFFNCLKSAAKKVCGDEFTAWIWSYQEQLWSSHLYHIECLVGLKFTPGEIAIVSMCGIATVLCIIFSIMSFVYKPNKKVKKNTEKTSVSAVQMGETNHSFTRDREERSANQETSRLTRRHNTEAKMNVIEEI